MISWSFLFYYAIVVYSVTFAYLESPLFKRQRQWVTKHIHRSYGECYHCTSFWFALVIGVLFFDVRGWTILLDALFASAMAVFFDAMVSRLCAIKQGRT